MKLFAVFLLLFGCKPSAHHEPGPTDERPSGPWRTLSSGIEFGRFPAPGNGQTEMQMVQIDPSKLNLVLLSAAAAGHPPLTADQWAKKYALLAVINAGMFEPDQTHCGYMKNGDVIRPEAVKKDYSSAVAFGPSDKADAAFRIHELDDLEVIKGLATRYRVVIQNLRLIKRPRENRWPQQPKQWSEAALGEDGAGRVLFIFSRAPASMHDFNEHLLKLPLDLACAQHLEGGPEASLYVNTGGFVFEGMGSYETGFTEHDNNRRFWGLPNVIGIREGK